MTKSNKFLKLDYLINLKYRSLTPVIKVMQIKPLSDHILIEPARADEKTEAGILLPDTASKEKSEQGVIIAVGDGKKTDDGKIVPMSVKKGDKVLFTKYGPSEIKVDGKEYLIATESDILAIIE